MPDPASPAALDPTDLISLLRSPEASRDLRAFAARGLLPLASEDRVRALLAVLDDPDPEVSSAAVATFAGVPPDDLVRFLDRGGPTADELDAVSRRTEDHAVLEQVIRNRETTDETLHRLALTITGAPQDALVVNQVRLLRSPALIDSLLENPSLTADGRRRLLEMREEFFEKEERRREKERLRQEEEARRAEQEAAGIVFEEAALAAGEADAAEGAAEDAEDAHTSANLAQMFRRISQMTVKEKLDLAQKGSKEERRILIGDANKIVSMAVLRNEALTPAEMETFCAMRHLATELFHEIASTREWIRKPRIQLALVNNPAVPLAISLPLIKFLGMRDLRIISRDRNLPEGVRATARKMLLDKRG